MDDYVKVVSRKEFYKDDIEKFTTRFLLLEIVRGMKLTIKTLFTRPVTRRYPKEKRKPVQGFRGLHALVRNNETGDAKCVGCGLCASVCPSKCINIHTYNGKNNEKIVDRYEVEVLRCVYCSFCMEVCPFQAIVLTERFDYPEYERESLYYTKDSLLNNWDKYITEEHKKTYFEKFWGPKSGYYTENENQAVFTREVL